MFVGQRRGKMAREEGARLSKAVTPVTSNFSFTLKPMQTNCGIISGQHILDPSQPFITRAAAEIS